MKEKSAMSISKVTVIAIHKITTQIVIMMVVTVAVQRAKARLARLSIIFAKTMICLRRMVDARARNPVMLRMRTAM